MKKGGHDPSGITSVRALGESMGCTQECKEVPLLQPAPTVTQTADGLIMTLYFMDFIRENFA